MKLQPPQDILSRAFMLEYMRELTPELLYTKANPVQKKQLFYKFMDEDKESVDLNWEYCLFEAPLTQLEALLTVFLDEVMEIERKRIIAVKKMVAKQEKEPASINLMDFARADIEASKKKIIS